MKREGYLYEKMEDKELIKEVIIKGAKGKKKRTDVKTVLKDIEGYTDKIYELVSTHSYAPTPPKKRTIKDSSSGKERVISIVPYYPDGIMHQLVTEVMRPMIMRGMYYWSCASIPGRGNKHAADYVKRALRSKKKTKYTAKLDIHHYYPNINRDLLMKKLEQRIKDKAFLKIIKDIIDTETDPGLAIGFYINQWLANFYLRDIDNLITSLDGVEFYVRNMDDFVLMGPNKRKLRKAISTIMDKLAEMGLELNKSRQVFKTDSRGIDFVGYRFFHDHIILRDRNFLKLERQSRRIQKGETLSFHTASGMLSRAGQLKHCNGHNIRVKYIDPIRIKKLKNVVRANAKKGGKPLKNALVIDANEIKKMIAEKFGVPETSVIKSQYSYTVVLDDVDKRNQKTDNIAERD